MDTNTTLLGNSQTFFGVLATLVILCIFHDGNNFIYRALREIFVSLRKKLSELESESNEFVQRLDDNDEIKKFKQLIKNKGTDFYRIDMKLLSEGTTLLDNVELARIKIFSYLDGYKSLVEFWRKHSLRNSESLLSSLFVFLYCLVVFALDEEGNSPGVITFLWLFTALSFSFLSSIWYHYWKRTKPKFNKHKFHPELSKKSVLQILLKYICYFLVVFVCSVIILIISHWMKSSGCGYILLIFLFISALLLGNKEILHFSLNPKRYTKIFLILHFIYLFCFSWLLVVVFYGVDRLLLPLVAERLPDFHLDDFQSFFLKGGLKISVFIFVLLNGVVFPFCIPYYCLKKIYSNLVDTIDDLKETAKREEDRLTQGFNAFYGKVMKDMLSKHSSPK